jgi:hypothetical protein
MKPLLVVQLREEPTMRQSRTGFLFAVVISAIMISGSSGQQVAAAAALLATSFMRNPASSFP